MVGLALLCLAPATVFANGSNGSDNLRLARAAGRHGRLTQNPNKLEHQVSWYLPSFFPHWYREAWFFKYR